MLFAFSATVLFCLSAITAARSARLLGGTEANFWRLAAATVLLGAWAYGPGGGAGGTAFPWFFLSGLVGFGLGDVAFFQALPRLGARLTSLLVHCLAAPVAAAAEWAWMDTRLSPREIGCGIIILVGVAVALAPRDHLHLPRRTLWLGVGFGLLAAVGQGWGAVLSRHAFAVAAAHHETLDGPTAAFQRILGGILVAGVVLLVVKREHFSGLWDEPIPRALAQWRGKWRESWGWVTLNALAGPALGVACFQWALQTTPAGVVLPIVATVPVVIIPFSVWLEGERLNPRSVAGGLVAVAGAVLLARYRTA